MVWVVTWYCSPALRTGKGRGREGGGLYPELGILGFLEGKSPALVRSLGSLCAQMPSYAAVHTHLREEGSRLTLKEVHGIGVHLGQAVLAYRNQEIELYRQGKLPPGQLQDGQGKRFGVQVDGGRIKIRRTTRHQKGRGAAKTQKRRYRSEWREPKVLIVYEMDAQGNLKAGTQPCIDGTLGGPDQIMEILALRLHQMGAAQAEVVAFRSDGAPWIWDRLDWVIQRVGLKPRQVSRGLDWPHAVHHVSLALEKVLEGAERTRVFKKFRKWLKAGRWEKVVSELTALGTQAELPPKSEYWTATDYLEAHGAAGHLAYATFRRRRLPLGSGAIESTIRRVVNLRLKGPSLHWVEPNADGMMALRSLVVSGRWPETFAKILAWHATNRRLDQKMNWPDMTAQLNANTPIKPPWPQHPSPQGTSESAA